MDCNFCHYYDPVEGVCKFYNENVRGDDSACTSFRYFQGVFSSGKAPEDFFSLFLDGGRYLIEGRKEADLWRCFMADTQDCSFMEMFYAVFFNITKEEAVKKFLKYVQSELTCLHQKVSDELYEISKKEYLSLMAVKGVE